MTNTGEPFEEKYSGMSKEAEEDYNKRQNEPLFKTAKQMIPVEQVNRYYENLKCGFNKRDGCQLLVRDKSLYACIYHQAIQATGEDFMLYYNMMNDNEYEKLKSWQLDKLEERKTYMLQWLKNYFRISRQ